MNHSEKKRMKEFEEDATKARMALGRIRKIIKVRGNEVNGLAKEMITSTINDLLPTVCEKEVNVRHAGV